MTELNCPHCNLAIQVRAAYLAVGWCPRCIAQRHVAVPMYETPPPELPRAAVEATPDVRA